MPARKAIRRWAWRLFRREWRQQALVLFLLVVAVAAMVVGLGVANNADRLKHDPFFGTANTVVTLKGSDPVLAADIGAIQSRFGAVDVIAHENIPIPGSVSSVDIRAEDPHGPYGNVNLRVDSGRFPNGPGEVAVTKDVANAFGLRLGSRWTEAGKTLQVVGIVENPLDLLDQFALVSPGQIRAPDRVSVLLNAGPGTLESLRLPSHTGLDVMARGTKSSTLAEVLVLILGSLGLLFVGLMAVAGFTVMAHRRLRSLGMLGALGATDRHIRGVMLANGAAVGSTSALLGAIAGLGGWMLFVPTLESISAHRIDRFSLPWWAISAAMVLTFVTAVGAAWWPARSVARVSIVAALSGRPPRPQPAHRSAAVGAALLSTGLVLLAFADGHRAPFIIVGTVTTAVGLLLLSPLAIRAMAAAGRRSPISMRLALRDLSRYQARSGAALGSITLAIGIAATIAISASTAESDSGPGNLPRNEMMLYLTAGGPDGVVPPLSPGQQQSVTAAVSRLTSDIHAQPAVPLEQAYDPRSDLVPSPDLGKFVCSDPCAGGGAPDGYPPAGLSQVTLRPQGVDATGGLNLYVAAPDLLNHFGISDSQINSSTDIISSRTDLRGLDIFAPIIKGRLEAGSSPKYTLGANPVIQDFKRLPKYGSDPATLITSKAVQRLGLQPIFSGWLVETDAPLTTTQINEARQIASGAGLYVETRTPQRSFAPLRNWSTTAGILLALGVLAMTVGLIRSETANDLRTLTATGASSRTRRNLTAATAGGLAFLGAVVGTAGAYAALLVWHRSDLTPLSHMPVGNLVVILVGLPLLAGIGGWLLAGREPAVISRRPIE
jgi:putative ABC transport system permease protein